MGRKLGIIGLVLLLGCAQSPLVLHLGSPPEETYTTRNAAHAVALEVQITARCGDGARLIRKFDVAPAGEYSILAYQEGGMTPKLELDRTKQNLRTRAPTPAAEAAIGITFITLAPLLIPIMIVVAIPMIAYDAAFPWLPDKSVQGCFAWVEDSDGLVSLGTPPFYGVSDR